MVPFGLRYIRLRLNSRTGFVRRDGGAFHADAVLLDGQRRIHRHLVVGLVAVFDAEVEVFEVDVQVGQDQLLFDETPDDAGHLVAIQFDDGGFHLDLGHELNSPHGLARQILPGRDYIAWGRRCAKVVKL
jgi:hypothetical protein